MDFRQNASDIQQAGSFLTRQLLKVLPKTYEKRYADLWAERGDTAIPIVGSLEGYEEQIEAQIFEAAAKATEYADRSTDIRIVSSSITTDKYNVHCYAVATEIGYKELKAERASTINKIAKQTQAANRALRQEVHQLLLFGDAKRGSDGFYNNPNVPLLASGYDPNTATWQDHVDYFTNTFAAIADANELTEGIRYVFVPNKLRAKLATTYQAGDSGKSALEAIMDGNSVAAGGTFQGFLVKNECRADLLERFGVRPPGTNEDRLIFVPENADAVGRASGSPDVIPSRLVDMVYRTVFFYNSSETIIQYPDAMAYEDVPLIV